MGAVATPAPADLGAAIQAALSGGDTSTGTLQTGETVVTQTAAEPIVQPQSEGGQEVPAPSEAAPAQTEGATEEVVDDFDMGLDPPAEDEPAPAPDGEAKAEEAQPEHAMSRSEADKITQAFMRTPSGRRMRSHDLAMQELAKPPEEGGLGITPTVDQIKEFHQAYLQHQRFIEHFNSGDPQNHAAIAHFLFGVNPQDGTPPLGAAEFIDALPDHLSRANPALKQHLQTKLVAEVINTPNSPLYEQVDLSVASRLAAQFDQLAQHAVNEADKVRWADAAMLVRYARGISAQGDPQAAAQAENDPEKQQLKARLEQIERERKQEAQTAQQRAIQSARGKFYGTVEDAIKTDVDNALAVIKDKVGPATFEAHRTTLLGKLRDVAKRVAQNETVVADINRSIGAVLQSRNPSAFDGVVRTIRRAYQDTLLESRKQILADVGVRLKAKSAEATAKLQQAQQHTEASPTAPSAGIGGAKAVPERLPTESAEEHLARVLATALKS